jgi:hypothetical protein
MKRKTFLALFASGAIAVGALAPAVALAHNAGHIDLPTGECVNVGGANEVLLPPPAQAPQTADGKLDLNPDVPGDNFGARFAVDQGNTPILRGHSEGCR